MCRPSSNCSVLLLYFFVIENLYSFVFVQRMKKTAVEECCFLKKESFQRGNAKREFFLGLCLQIALVYNNIVDYCLVCVP